MKKPGFECLEVGDTIYTFDIKTKTIYPLTIDEIVYETRPTIADASVSLNLINVYYSDEERLQEDYFVYSVKNTVQYQFGNYFIYKQDAIKHLIDCCQKTIETNLQTIEILKDANASCTAKIQQYETDLN